MARNNSKPTDPAALTQRVAVIESRRPWFCYGEMRDAEWKIYTTVTDRNSKKEMDKQCARLALESHKRQFRWRYGLLTLDTEDKCEIFKYDDNEKKEKN